MPERNGEEKTGQGAYRGHAGNVQTLEEIGRETTLVLLWAPNFVRDFVQ